MCRHIEKTFRQSLDPSCVVFPFGSTINGLGFRGCDIDVYIDLISKFDAFETEYMILLQLQLIKGIFVKFFDFLYFIMLLEEKIGRV